LPDVRMYGGKNSSRFLPPVFTIARTIERRHATRTDSEIESLSEMPADGISLPPKKGFGTAPVGGSRGRVYKRRHRPEGVMTACGTSRRMSRARKNVGMSGLVAYAAFNSLAPALISEGNHSLGDLHMERLDMEALPKGANFVRAKTLWEIGLHIA